MLQQPVDHAVALLLAVNVFWQLIDKGLELPRNIRVREIVRLCGRLVRLCGRARVPRGRTTGGARRAGVIRPKVRGRDRRGQAQPRA